MSSYSTGSIHEYVRSSIGDFPAADSGTALNFIVDFARIKVGNWVGGTLGTSFDEKYFPAICATAMLLEKARIAGAGVNYNFSTGEFNISPNAASQPELVRYAELMEAELQSLGRKARWQKVFG